MGFCQIIKIVSKIGLPLHNSIHAMNAAAHVVVKIFLNDSQEKFQKPISSQDNDNEYLIYILFAHALWAHNYFLSFRLFSSSM